MARFRLLDNGRNECQASATPRERPEVTRRKGCCDLPRCEHVASKKLRRARLELPLAKGRTWQEHGKGCETARNLSCPISCLRSLHRPRPEGIAGRVPPERVTMETQDSWYSGNRQSTESMHHDAQVLLTRLGCFHMACRSLPKSSVRLSCKGLQRLMSNALKPCEASSTDICCLVGSSQHATSRMRL